MTDKHERIYLQDGDGGERLEEGTTWCQDQINDDDTEYVRADLYVALEQRVERLEGRLDYAEDVLGNVGMDDTLDYLEKTWPLASQEEADLDKLTTQQKPTEEAMEEA